MNKLSLTLILIAGGFSPLFSMSQQEHDIQRLLKKEEKRKLKKKIKKKISKKEGKKIEALKERTEEAEKKAEGREEEIREQYVRDFSDYKAAEIRRIKEEGAEQVLRINNTSKWNVLVQYKHEDSLDELKKWPIQRTESYSFKNPEGITFLEIVPDSQYWEENLDKFIASGKVKVPDLSGNITKVLKNNPDTSVEIIITIPQLPGGKFKGFAFEVQPVKPKEFTMTLEEYIEKRESGDIQAPSNILGLDPSLGQESIEEMIIQERIEKTTKDDKDLTEKVVQLLIEKITDAQGLTEKQKQSIINKLLDNQSLSPEEEHLIGEFYN